MNNNCTRNIMVILFFFFLVHAGASSEIPPPNNELAPIAISNHSAPPPGRWFYLPDPQRHPPPVIEPPVASPPPIRRQHGKSLPKPLVIFLSVLGGLIAALLVALGCAMLYLWRRKKRAKPQKEEVDIECAEMDKEFMKETLGAKKFSYQELVLATNNFQGGGKVGQGGFGSVYKGFLIGLDLNIAVKRISKGSKQGKKEYMSEVKVISRLRHKNLVQLIGWCHERDELLLVYELLENTSLDTQLHGGGNVLSWQVRYKIAEGMACGLHYLHEECDPCVLHRDIKSSNIMLDSNFNAKLGDFGLARLMDNRTTELAGTMGYFAPECFTTGKSNKETEIYSFGVVLLEMASGRKPQDAPLDHSLVDWVWDLYASGKVIDAADPNLQMKFDVSEMARLVGLGLWCCDPNPRKRPSAAQVLDVLQCKSPMPNLHSGRPELARSSSVI